MSFRTGRSFGLKMAMKLIRKRHWSKIQEDLELFEQLIEALDLVPVSDLEQNYWWMPSKATLETIKNAQTIKNQRSNNEY